MPFIPTTQLAQVGGAGVLLYSQVLGADGAIDTGVFTSSGYTSIMGIYRLRATAAANFVQAQMRFNNDSGGNYQQVNAAGGGAGAQSQGVLGRVTAATGTANNIGAGTFFVGAASSTSLFKGCIALDFYMNVGVASLWESWAFEWDSAAAITRIQLVNDSASTWAAGSALTVIGF